jgi:hypothetical protein
MSFVVPRNGFGLLPLTDRSFRMGMVSPSNPSGVAGSFLGDAVRGYVLPPPPPPSSINALAAALATSAAVRSRSLLADALIKPETKRKVYFAFRFQDIMRVNNVRKAWCIDHPNKDEMRSFYDRSIWGTSKSTNPDTLKASMRKGVEYSSATCVLIGTNTWQSRWVKYEIARSVIDKRGLVAVHINCLNHVARKLPDINGYNPLHCMGIFHSTNGKYYIYENTIEVDPSTGQLTWAWRPYDDFTEAVSLPVYMPSMMQGYVDSLWRWTSEYDYVRDNGHANIGAWIDRAAAAVNR